MTGQRCIESEYFLLHISVSVKLMRPHDIMHFSTLIVSKSSYWHILGFNNHIPWPVMTDQCDFCVCAHYLHHQPLLCFTKFSSEKKHLPLLAAHKHQEWIQIYTSSCEVSACWKTAACKRVLTFTNLLSWQENRCWRCGDCNQQNKAWVLCKGKKRNSQSAGGTGECKPICPPHASKQMPEKCSRSSIKFRTIDPRCSCTCISMATAPKAGIEGVHTQVFLRD